MYLKCTRVSRIPENGVILLSQIVPFRRIANTVEKKQHHFSIVTGNAVPVADAQADLSLCWAHNHFVCFVMRWLICVHHVRRSEIEDIKLM